MADTTPLATVAEAFAIVVGHIRVLPTVRLPLSEAGGMTLGEPVVCDVDYPPFDRAMMDGFAVRAADCAEAPTTLRVRGEVAAGQAPRETVNPGEALRINTGAPMPPGADAVVVIEKVTLSDDGRQVTTPETPAPGHHVAPRGSAVRAGEVVLEPGAVLGPAQIASAAAAGAAEVTVHRRPRLAVLVTGDELIPIEERPVGGQIRNSNGPCIVALARESGCEVIDLGVVADDRGLLADRIAAGLDADILCITGGVSMGQHDYVPEMLAAAGVETRLRKVAIKPGKPTLFGRGPQGQAVFALAGNPVSCFVCFQIFVRPMIVGMQGRPPEPPVMLPATLETALPPARGREEYLPARLERAEVVATGAAASSGAPPGPPAQGVPLLEAVAHAEAATRATWRPVEWRVSAVRWTGSGDPFGMGRANGLIVRPANAPAAEAGTTVAVIPLSA